MPTVKALTLAALLIASRAVPGAEPVPRPAPIAPPTRIPHPVHVDAQPPGKPVATASMPRAVRRAVVADAARRFEVSESSVVLSDAEQVTWSDGSLGCPQPGMTYLQALVPGYRVAATTSAGRLLYHTDAGGSVVTCAPRARSPGLEPRR
jgi:hypothetical protein